MKKLLIILFFIIGLYVVKAQSWAPTIGTYWYQSFASDPTWCSDGYVKFEYYKDSLINGQNCQVIRRFRHQNCQSGLFANYDMQIYTYTGSNNVVYVNDYLSTANVQTQNFDTLFYFNAAIGYKWRISPDSYTTCTGPKSVVTIADTGHKIIQGVNLKWQKVTISTWFNGSSSFLFDTIYERFGYLRTNEFEPYNFCTNFTDGGSITTLRCYGDNQIINFKYGHNYNCDYILGIKEEEQLQTEIFIYPNPSQTHVSVRSEHYDLTNSTIRITNQIGQLVVCEDYTHSISIGNLSAGLYTMLIKLKDGTVVSKKWIKE